MWEKGLIYAKTSDYYRVVLLSYILKCIITCCWPRRPHITNKVTFAQGD